MPVLHGDPAKGPADLSRQGTLMYEGRISRIRHALPREMARRLAREEGIFAGISTGLNVAAALQLATELGPGARVATVAVDTGLKYLAGDLFG